MMQKRFKVAWTDWRHSEERLVADHSSIQEIIDALSLCHDPPALLLIWEEGTTRELGVGLGRAQTVLTYQESADPPYYISLGQPDAEGDEWFCHGHERTEYLARNLVPSEVIGPTVKMFVTEPFRPTTVMWEQL
jgi:hypothetical protein